MHGSTHFKRNGQEKNERKKNDKIKSVCAGFSKHIQTHKEWTQTMLTSCFVSVLKKRKIAKNAVAPRKHKVWVRKLLTERKWKGEYHVLVKEMMLFDHETFYKQFRMSPSRYESLLQMIAPLIIKSSMKREAIHPSERLLITLRALCSGDSNFTISCSYRVGVTTSLLCTQFLHTFFSCIPFCTFEPT